MTAATIVVLVAAILGAVWGVMSWTDLTKPYRIRACQGRAWRRAFPDASKEEIRAFLSTFTDGFGFPKKERLKFGPADRPYAIYREMYPSLSIPDGLEFETWSDILQKRYVISMAGRWRDDLTFAEIFTWVRSTR